jgi:hypothetical protein
MDWYLLELVVVEFGMGHLSGCRADPVERVICEVVSQLLFIRRVCKTMPCWLEEEGMTGYLPAMTRD